FWNIAPGAMRAHITAYDALKRIFSLRNIVPEGSRPRAEVIDYNLCPAFLNKPDKGHIVYLVTPDKNTGLSRSLRPRTTPDFGNKMLDQIDMLRGRNPHARHKYLCN